MKITDKMRLDWLMKKEAKVFKTWHNKPKFSWVACYGSHPSEVWGCAGTPRQAIDAAIRAERRGK
jgi:hypothetical protein